MNIKQLQSLYQIKVSLKGSKPPIWRRLLVHSSMNLNAFHEVIQISMGWQNSHLHQFEKDGILYGMVDDEFENVFGPEPEDETQYKLSDLLKSEQESLDYEYDFGDGWGHKVVLEKILPFDSSSEVAACIKGKRACPPEDCGGIWGYENLLGIISDSEHPEHKEMMQWLGDEFDPEHFCPDETNRLLAQYFK